MEILAFSPLIILIIVCIVLDVAHPTER